MKNNFIFFLLLTIITSSLIAADSDPSEIVGFIKYECTTTAGSNLNLIALPLDNNLTKASDLANLYNSISSISKWRHDIQTWSTATKDFMNNWQNDFDLELYQMYLINVTEETDIFITGSFSDNASYSFQTENGLLNSMSLPLNKENLTTAGELAEDITTCNAVSKWVVNAQTWTTSTKDFMGNWQNNFSIETGSPYLISIYQNTIWPTSKKQEIKKNNIKKSL